MIASTEWVSTGLTELAKFGPFWIFLGLVAVSVVFNWQKIVGAHTDRWRIKQETKLKLEHKRVRFREGVKTRRDARKKLTPPAGKQLPPPDER